LRSKRAAHASIIILDVVCEVVYGEDVGINVGVKEENDGYRKCHRN